MAVLPSYIAPPEPPPPPPPPDVDEEMGVSMNCVCHNSPSFKAPPGTTVSEMASMKQS